MRSFLLTTLLLYLSGFEFTFLNPYDQISFPALCGLFTISLISTPNTFSSIATLLCGTGWLLRLFVSAIRGLGTRLGGQNYFSRLR